MYHWNYLDYFPLLAVFFGTTFFIMLASEAGNRLGLRHASRLADGETPHLAPAVAATLGLLAFMLAFTFGAGTDRLQTKRALVLQESNAIGTAMLRADLLPEPYRKQAQRMFAEYVDLLISTTEEQDTPEFVSRGEEYAQAIQAGLLEARALHGRLWAEAVAVAAQAPTPVNSLYLSALNEVFDILQMRITVGMQYRMPGVFWVVLYSLAFLALALSGYEAGVSRSRRNHAMWAVALAFASVMTLVIALDRPQTSAVRQLPLLDLQADIRAAMKQG
ncbi:MAG: hypothetical protein R3E54_12915 [Halioglobus sp.]